MPITNKHKSTILSGIVVALGASMLAGCAADPIEVPKSETYTRDFIKTFGIFDQSHDWNHATQTAVNVTTAKATDIKIYAIVDNVRYLFGTYLGVEGQQTLNVDVPKGTTELIIRANGQDYKVAPGASLAIGSRSRANDASNDQIEISPEDSNVEHYKYLSTDEVLSYREKLPESNQAGDIGNLGKVTQNFMFNATKDFVLYPVYWQTSQADELGIYYRKADETNPENFKMVPVYTNMTGVLQRSAGLTEDSDWQIISSWEGEDFSASDYDWDTFCDRYCAYTKASDTEYSEITTFEKPNEWSDSKDHYQSSTCPRIKGKYYKWENTSGESSYKEGCPYYRSKGIVIRLTPNVTYGFYLKHPQGYTFYSEAEFNETIEGTLEDKDTSSDTYGTKYPEYTGKKAPHFGIYETKDDDGNPRMVLGAEDWINLGAALSDNDLNDIVIFVENITPDEEWPPFKTEDEDIIDTPYDWIIACEDLGTDDFDFNDVVFAISNKTVTDEGATIDVTALASGGTLPVYLWHNGKCIVPEGNTAEGEFHSWFGNYSSNQIINARSFSGPGATATISVDKDFTMSCCQTVDGDSGSGNMGGFQVRVKYPSGDEIIEAANPNLEKKIGEAPQMICVPHTWLWPVENRIITDVYSEFTTWCENYDAELGWHKDPMGAPGSHYVYRDITTTPTPGPDDPNPDDPDTPKPIELTSAYYDDGWGAGERYKYSIKSEYLADATSVKIAISYSGAESIAIMNLSDGNYQTATYSNEFTGDELDTLKKDGAFYILYRNTNDLKSKVTITVTSIKAE